MRRPSFQTSGTRCAEARSSAGLFIVGFPNEIFERLAGTIAQGTVSSAISSTFGISILVWLACWIAVSLLVRQKAEPVPRSDVIVGFAVAVLVRSAPASYRRDHPNVAIRLNNLAQLLHATNRDAEAEPMYRRALAITEASYGLDHRGAP